MKRTLSKEIIRTCVITRNKESKDNLVQITNTKNGWKINCGDLQGRSFYLLKDKDVINKFVNLKKQRVRNFVLEENLKEELIQYGENL